MKAENMFNLGLLLIFVGLGIQLFVNETSIIIGSVFSTMGLIFAIRGHLMKKRPDSVKKDERSRKIGAFSASWSWIITIFVLMIMFWINKLNIIPLGVNEVIALTYIAMVSSLLIFKYHFNKKGDVL